MGPMSDGPDWPSDAAWLAMQTGPNGCLMSDGLSDPWVEPDRPDTGLGLEMFMQSPDHGLEQLTNPSQLADSWLFPSVAEISHTLAKYPRLCETLLDGTPIAVRFNIEHIKDGRGLVGALLHLAHTYPNELHINGDAIRLIAATLLTSSELDYLRGKGQQGREQLLQQLRDNDFADLSLLNRPSVL